MPRPGSAMDKSLKTICIFIYGLAAVEGREKCVKQG